jgi:hypothetical protein
MMEEISFTFIYKAFAIERYKGKLIKGSNLTETEVSELNTRIMHQIKKGEYQPDEELEEFLFDDVDYPDDPRQLLNFLEEREKTRNMLQERVLREIKIGEL